jgi:hypothetical protein
MSAARVALCLALLAAAPRVAVAETPAERFRAGNDLARGGDYPGAVAVYRELAASGHASASLYWNWAQAAQARGAAGEALWALLMARELEPGDRAIGRGIERLREDLSLDPAELSPEPLAAGRRWSRRLGLGLAAAALLVLSVLLHGGRRLLRRLPSAVGGLGWAAFGLGGILLAVVLTGALARPTGVVVRRGAPLLEAASPTAEALGSLREGEVLPILERSGDYVRVQDSSGARGWALGEDVAALTLAR